MYSRKTHLLVLASWILLVGSAVSQRQCCPSSWFGSRCQYKCHCPSSDCTTDTGCGGEVPCEKGWFGPACQYMDLAYGRGGVTSKHPSLLSITDGDDLTCAPCVNDNVTIILDHYYLLTWFRFRFSNYGISGNLTINFGPNANLGCTNQRTSEVDPVTTDIYCDLNQRINRVTISGPSMLCLCSVYISGGRNVALKQNVTHTDSFWAYTAKSPHEKTAQVAENAVDGNRTADFYEGTCSHTYTNTNPSLTLTFSTLQHVTRYYLFNRLDSHNTPPVYMVNVTVSSEHLTVCELEIYGDSACEPGQYGLECEHTCNCAGGEPCFISTGGCPSGCAAGFQGESCSKECDRESYGPGCQLSCSHFCVRKNNTSDRICDNISGLCLHGCHIGYQSPTCVEKCNRESYGQDCKFSCSLFCVRNDDTNTATCDNVNGTCFHGCQAGYQGSTCDKSTTLKCDSDSYGPGCSLSCSQFCQRENVTSSAICDNVDGTCLHGCQSGYQGSTCDKMCDSDSYGPGCSFSCSQFCGRENDTSSAICDNANGKCLHGCQSGYQGSTCDARCDIESYGPECNASCSQFCLRQNTTSNTTCDNINGTCLHGCQSGYQGSTCHEKCDNASYGPGCSLSCSQFCVRGNDTSIAICDNVNGTCLHGCQSGYLDSTCDEKCDGESYGPECNASCSQFCVRLNDTSNATCDNVNGTCLHGCQSGYQGSTCTEKCGRERYGSECNASCSQFCVRLNDSNNATCDHVNGTCLHGCQSGYQGSTCNEKCDRESYGPQCNASCHQFCVRENDTSDATCDNVNGTCLYGCQSGYQGSTCNEKCDSASYGPGCSMSCSQFCVRGNDTSSAICNNVDGICLHGCQSGYQGTTCNEKCDRKHYGAGCGFSCSQFCVRRNDTSSAICDNVDGTCFHGCQSGYQGSTCDEKCDSASYGQDCSMSCSQFCVRESDTSSAICDNVDGTCLHGCQRGYLGSTCREKCNRESYGPECNASCSQFCVRENDTNNATCDNVDGTCLHGCQTGYQGSTCNEKQSNDKNDDDINKVVITVPVGLAAVVLLVVIIILYTRFIRNRNKEGLYDHWNISRIVSVARHDDDVKTTNDGQAYSLLDALETETAETNQMMSEGQTTSQDLTEDGTECEL